MDKEKEMEKLLNEFQGPGGAAITFGLIWLIILFFGGLLIFLKEDKSFGLFVMLCTASAVGFLVFIFYLMFKRAEKSLEKHENNESA